MPYGLLKYYFTDKDGNKLSVPKKEYDADPKGFAAAYPGSRFEVVNRKTGERGDVAVGDLSAAKNEGFDLFTVGYGSPNKKSPSQSRAPQQKRITPLAKAQQKVATTKWGNKGTKGSSVPSVSASEIASRWNNGAPERHAAIAGRNVSYLDDNPGDSELVLGLRHAENAKRQLDTERPIDYLSRYAVQDIAEREHEHRRQRDIATDFASSDFVNKETRRRNKPIVDTGIPSVNNSIVKTQGQLEKEMEESGKNVANDKSFTDAFSNIFKQESNAAFERGQRAANNFVGMSPTEAVFGMTLGRNEEMDPEKRLANVTKKVEASMTQLVSAPQIQERIAAESKRLGVSPEEYVQKSLVPSLMNKLSSDFDKTELKNLLPKGALETILMHAQTSMTGTLASMGLMTKAQRQYGQRALQETLSGNNPYYTPGMWTKAAGGALAFAMDAPVFGAAGKVGGAVAGRVLGNATAQGMRIANTSLAGRIARMAAQGTVSQGVTGVLYGATNAAVQNYSTGDDTSIGNTVKLMAKSGVSEGASWATMGAIGGAVGASIYNVGGVKRIPAKLFQVAMEGVGMHAGGNVAKTIEGEKTDWLSVEGNLQDVANVVVLKLTHGLPKRGVRPDGKKESYLDFVARNIKNLVTSDAARAKAQGMVFTEEEKQQLFGSTHAPERKKDIYEHDAQGNPKYRYESLTSWAMRTKRIGTKASAEESYRGTDVEFVKTAYDQIMADNTIPWDTKAKFSALVMGTTPSARPMMSYGRIGKDAGGDFVGEYSKYGELLSKTYYKTADERSAITYRLSARRENQRLQNAYGAAQIKDEKATEDTIANVGKEHGFTAEQIKAAMDKDPLRRSDEEQKACIALRKAFESEQFKPGTLHEDQSGIEGKDVVEENNLGTETPNSQAVVETMGELATAEKALQEAMDGDDTFKQEYERLQKQGLSNAQIYQELINTGLTQEKLAPLADYINANAKAQGMFRGTQQKIEETVQKRVADWGYKGKLNGDEGKGESIVYVKDKDGRLLIVGAGDVSFGEDGRATDGDMLTVLDPQTNEMDFVSVKDVQIDHIEKAEDYANAFRQKLQEINSEGYQAAAQQQAEQEQQPAPKQEQQPAPKQGEQPAPKQGEQPAPKQGEQPAPKQGEQPAPKQGEQPAPKQGEPKPKTDGLKFKDGTPVPMMKDSKGRDTADYSKMTPEQGAEYLTMLFGENAGKVLDGKIKKAEAAVKAAERMKVDYDAEEPDIIEAEAKKKAALEAAQKELEYFTAVKNMMKQAKAEESAGGEGLTGNKYEQWRKDGYHIGEGGVRYDRQKKEDMKGVYGREVKVDFSPTVSVKGRAKVVEIDSVQASHVNGQVNPMHFGPDWQPKDRTDAASKDGQDKALTNFDPEKITGDGNAFIGSSPSVDERHEVIQGNNRAEILRRLYDEYPEKAAKYKQWLIDHAKDFGYDPEEIAKMKRPVLVNELPVDDATAKKLGQYRASDFESGGKEMPRASVVINRLGDKMQSIANILLNQGSLPDDAKLNDFIAQNASRVLDYLVKEGVITVTEEQTLRKDGTTLRQWMAELLKTGLFDGDKQMEAAFNSLPDNARKAVLATYMRDAKSDDSAKIKQNLQHSFEAYAQMMNTPAFANAKNVAEARAAIAAEIEGGNISFFGEKPIRDRYSNFELELAALYKGLKDQKTLTGLLNKYFDAVQGDKATGKQLEIGEEPSEAIKKDEAIKNVFGLHDAKPAETQRQVDEAVKKIATEITKQTGIEVVTDEEGQQALDDAEAANTEVKFHKVKDKDELEELNKGGTFRMFSGMQIWHDGIYSPMAAIIDGKRAEATEVGAWMKADESPDAVIPVIDKKTGKQAVDEKTGRPKWQFNLEKTDEKKGAGEGDISAAYNPYMHLSSSMLNDQFYGCYARGNIIVVEWDVPKSELTSGYWAEKAKDPVGMLPWHSGSVNGLLPEERQRSVMLSRWRRAVRVVPDSEVAASIAKQLEGTDLSIPWNVVTPNQLRELVKLGVPITTKENGKQAPETKEAFLKQKAELEKEFPGYKFTDVKMTKDAYKEWGKGAVKKKTAKKPSASSAKGIEKAARDTKTRQFRTKDGEVYGFTDGEKIYLDTKKMKPETPLHEYTHLWSEALRRANPKEWEHVKGLFDKVDGLKEEVKKLYPELEGDDLYEEMITTFSGREGAKKLEDVVRKLAAEDGKIVTESAKAQGFIERVKTALKEYWKGVADLLHIHFTTAEEVADKVLADWAKGVDPRKIEGEKKPEEKPEGEKKPETPIAAEGGNKPETPPTNPVEGMKTAAKQYKEEQRERNGQQKEQTPEEKAAAKAKEMEENPLTMEEIDSYSTGDDDTDSLAKDYAKNYLYGDKRPMTEFFYNQIYENVRNRRQDGEGDSSPADPPHVDGGDNEPTGPGPDGGGAGPVGGGPSGTDVSGQLPGKKGGENSASLPDGEGGNKPVGGTTSTMEGLPTRSGGRGRGGNTRGDRATGGEPGAAPNDTGGAAKPKLDAKTEAKQSRDEVKDLIAEIAAKREANRKSDAGKMNAYPGLTAAVLGELSKKMLPRDKEEMILYGRLLIACAKHAYNVLRVYGEKIENWFKGMHDDLHDAIKDAYGDTLTDEDVDNFIRSLWDTEYTIDGKRQTIEKWAAEIGREKLRAALSVSLEEKRKKQQEAEKVEVKVGDADNIAESLPFLLPEQQNDVLKAETQFFDPSHADDEHGNGRGILFTNGTGTGKTYTGLGIAKRFIKQGKGRVLIVTPSPAKVQDWSNDAKNLGITLTPLKGESDKGATMQKGEGAVVTTFANFRQNRALMEDVFDLVIYDESHKLMENRQAQESATTVAHYRMTNKDFESAMERIQLSHPLWREGEELDAEKSKLMKNHASLDEARRDPEVSDESIERIEQIDKRLAEIEQEKALAMPELTKKANDSVGKTKVVFLSATPFNMRENLEYAEGYLFKYKMPKRPANISERKWRAMRNDARNQFYRQWFPHGERIGKSGRIEPYITDADKNDAEERSFADHLMHLGVMSGRTIDNGYDYSRDFPTVSVTHADRFNTAVKELMNSGELRKVAEKVFNDYNTMSVVYETMKASACAERIKEHLAMGRKVVVFHRRVNDRKGLARPPFANVLEQGEIYAMALEKNGGDGKIEALRVRKAIAEFEKKYADLLDWEQTLDYRMPRQQIASLLGDAHQYTAKELKARYNVQDKLLDPAFKGKGDPYKAGYEYGKTCFDPEDADIVDMYKPHEVSDEEAEMLGIKKPSKAQHKKEMDAYNTIAKQVRKGIEDNIRERIASGELKIEIDENGKKKRHVGMFAGADSTSAKLEDMKAFNNDDSDMDVMVVQEASGKEGISLHDTTGKHQRVMINLALPQSPIAFIQAEGRIYRIGQKSNAIFEYPLLGIDNEIMLFAGRFNGRAATTENLALGNMARGLKDAIMRGVLTKRGKVPLAGQGYGGREWDMRDDQRATGYDGAVRDWRTEDKGEQAGTIDDMDTPQPLGFKLAEWAKTNEGETVLEPSAGNGNVSRYLPSNAKTLSIEPDPKKYNNLLLITGGVERGSAEAAGRRTLTMNGKFEDLSTQSKFDTIIMNSPNGAEGQTAKKHLALAVAHLNDSGRIVAVLPETADMEKFVNELVEGNPSLRVTGEVKLPPCAYSIGGVSQKARVVTIDKLTREEMRKNWKETQTTDLSDITNIEKLVAKLKNVTMPDRVLDPAAKDIRHANMLKTKLERIDLFKSGKSRWSGVGVFDTGFKINIPSKFEKTLNDDFYEFERGGYHHSISPIAASRFSYNEIKELDSFVLARYKASSEILKMSDAEIREKCFNWRLKDKDAPLYVDALKQYSEAMVKAIRGISGRTDAQLLRAFEGEDIDNPVQVKAGTEMSASDYKALFEANNENEELGALFNRVYDTAKKLGLKIDVFDDQNTGTSAYYSNENRIRINASHWNAKKMVNERGQVVPATKAIRAEVLCHELIHSVTSYANYWYDHDPDSLPEGLREAAKELDDIYNKIIGSKESYRIPSYAKENKNELVAEMANPAVREPLKKMGIWTKLVNAVKRFFTGEEKQVAVDAGFAKDEDFEQSTVYNELAKTLDKFLNNFDEGSYDAYIALSGASRNGKHFRTENQYSKTNTIDVKNSRIVPEDVDKVVSSQIEKKFDEEIGEIEKDVKDKEQFRKQLAENVERISRTPRSELEKELEELKNNQNEEIRREESGGTENVPGGRESILDKVSWTYGNKAAQAAIERELEYRRVRAEHIRNAYGLQAGSKGQIEDISKILEDGKNGREIGPLWSKVAPVIKRLGVEINVEGEDKWHDAFGESSTFRSVDYYIDKIVRTSSSPKELPVTILHEMIHQGIDHAIHLVNSGKADGALTSRQIEAVNSILGIYEKTMEHPLRFKGNIYGLLNEYEFTAQMADPRQRKALELSVWDRVVNFAHELANKGDRSVWQTVKDAVMKLFDISDKDKMDKAIEDVLGDFNENAHGYAMADVDENGWSYSDGRNSGSIGNSMASPVDKTAERLSEIAAKTGEKLGAKVNTIQTVEEISDPQVRKDVESGKAVQGWYDEKTGEVHLYMPNIKCSRDAVKTVWRETVGHKGMRGLLGDKFQDYMRSLWMDLDNPANAELREYVRGRMAKEPLSMYDAIEEYIADAAENGKGEPSFWLNIKNKVADALHEIGYRIQPNVKDVKYMLWLAKNVQKHPNDPVWKMRAEAVKWKIEHEKFEGTKVHGGDFYANDGKPHDFGDMSKQEWLEATDGEIHYRTAPGAATALDRYHKQLNAHGYMATEAFMDNMLSLKALMQAMGAKVKKIEDIPSSENPYMLHNTMQGKASEKMQRFENDVMEPLTKTVAKALDAMDGKNDTERTRNLNLYMIKKHGLERNRVFFVRDHISKMDEAEADTLQSQWDAEKKDLGDKLRKGQIDLKEYYGEMDEWIRQNVDPDYKAEEHDYSGMHGIQGIMSKKAPYDDAAVIDEVMNTERSMESMSKGSVDELWSKIKVATQYALNEDYNNGFVTKRNHDHVSGMFDWYVPLRKFDEKTAEDVYGYVTENGESNTYLGPTLMAAKGRESLSNVNVLAQIGTMGNHAISRGAQNLVKMAFARFVRNNGGQGLVKETKVWVEKKSVDTNGKAIWEEVYPDIPEGATGDQMAGIVEQFEAEMEAKKAKGEAKSISGRGDIGFKFERAKNRNEHFVDVMIAGKRHRFVVLGNPRAAQALNGLLENEGTTTLGGKWIKRVTRVMAQMATSYAPEFVMRNVLRDAQMASAHVASKEGAVYAGKWMKYYAIVNPFNGVKNIRLGDMKGANGIGLYARYRKGQLDMNNKIEKLFKEFMENGGETGWVQMKNMQEFEKEYRDKVSTERSTLRKSGKALHDFFLGNVEGLNEMAENMARFATYCASREVGRGIVRSVYDAKEVSTNFNRHGSGSSIKTFKNGDMSSGKETRRNIYGFVSSYLQNYSMFFNAAIQSTNLLVKNAKRAPVTTTLEMASIPFGLGIVAALVNNALIANEDEKKRGGVKDPYAELPDYIRRNCLCIYKGNGEFATIPLAIELRAFYGMGDCVAGHTISKNIESQRNFALDMAGCASQLLPVVDFMSTETFDKNPVEETVKGIAPTAVASSVAEWWLNSDWKGAPIRRTGDYTKNNPAWKNAYSGTPDTFMRLNKWANASTNDVAPGNENMKGNDWADTATDPSLLNHLLTSLGGGAATFITRGVGDMKRLVEGKKSEIETKDIPFLRSLMYTPTEQSSMARTKAKWYDYKDELEKTTANYDTLKRKNVPLTERIRNLADLHKFETSNKARKIDIIKDAERQMKRWNRMKQINADDKKQTDFANKQIELIMQKAVGQMDKIGD